LAALEAGAAASPATAQSALLDVQGLRVNHGRRPVVFDIDLRVAPGEIVAMFGHNGAGKTTTLNAIFGRVKPAAGHVRFDGRDITSAGGVANVRAGITLIPAERFVFADLSVLDNLRLGAFHSRDKGTAEARLGQQPAGGDDERWTAAHAVDRDRADDGAAPAPPR
jgi:ABC-type branched-subunit amino acid transport system ATPase component